MGWFVIGLAACNAIAGLDGDFELGDASAPVGTGSSSGTSGNTTSSSSGGTSGTTSSSSSSSSSSSGSVDSGRDTGSDTGVDSGPPPNPCTGTTLFCDDFESANTFAKWKDKTGDFTDPTTADPHKKVARSNLTNANTNRKVWIVGDLGPAGVSALDAQGKAITLDFDFKIEALNADYAAIGVIRVNFQEYGLAAYKPPLGGPDPVPANCSSCVDQTAPGDTKNDYVNPHPISGGWQHAQVRVARTAGEWRGRVTVDGQTVDDRSTGAFLNMDDPAANVDVVVGTFYAGSGNPTTVLIDNVRVVSAN